MDHQDFKVWLAPVIGEPLKRKCKLCVRYWFNSRINCFEKKNQISQKHKLSVLSTKYVKHPINNYFDPKSIKLQEQIKRAETLLCGFLAEHNLSLNSIDHLRKLCQEAFTDSNIAKSLRISRTKATTITKNVIGKCYHEDLHEVN